MNVVKAPQIDFFDQPKSFPFFRTIDTINLLL
jgi:hypothetical protein